jgi:hypothetical protein
VTIGTSMKLDEYGDAVILKLDLDFQMGSTWLSLNSMEKKMAKQKL